MSDLQNLNINYLSNIIASAEAKVKHIKGALLK